MARLQQISFQFGESSRKKNGGTDFARQHPHNICGAAAVLNHYYFYLGKVPFADTRKLILQVREEPAPSEPTPDVRCDPLGIGYCRLIYDYKAIENLEGTPLKKMLLDAVHAGVSKYCDFFSIPTQPCEEARQAVLNDNMNFGFYFKNKKSYRDPESKKKFFLYIKFDWNELSVVAEVYEARSLIGSAFLYSTTPTIDPWAMMIRKPGWSTDRDVLLEPIQPKGSTTTCKLPLQHLEEGVKAESLAWSVQKPQPLSV